MIRRGEKANFDLRLKERRYNQIPQDWVDGEISSITGLTPRLQLRGGPMIAVAAVGWQAEVNQPLHSYNGGDDYDLRDQQGCLFRLTGPYTNASLTAP